MYPQVPWVQRITVIKYGNTFNYLKTTNIFPMMLTWNFIIATNLLIVFDNQRVTQCGHRRYDMYDQLTLYVSLIGTFFIRMIMPGY